MGGILELPWPPAKLSPNGSHGLRCPRQWTEQEDAGLLRLHGKMEIREIAALLGRTKGSVRSRITQLGIAKQPVWAAAEIEALRDAYAGADVSEEINLDALAAKLGRHKSNVCRKARSLGLTDSKRRLKRHRKVRLPKYKTAEERRTAIAEACSRYLATHGHPRGMFGKKHSGEAVAKTRAGQQKWWASMSEDDRAAHTEKALKSKLEKHGTLAPRVERGTWKAGWREIGDRRHYFRSRWEANYARYLQWLKERGEILDWEYEPETFWFDAIKRGVRSYKPDFRVHETSGAKPFHEVKGWMDARSKTTLKRMAKYHPGETVILIRQKEYKAIERSASRLVEGWE